MELLFAIPMTRPFLPSRVARLLSVKRDIDRLLFIERGLGTEQPPRVPGDHQFLVGGNHPGRNRTSGARDARATPLVRTFVELDAEPSRGLAHAFADGCGALTDSRREHDGVEAPEGGRHRTEL